MKPRGLIEAVESTNLQKLKVNGQAGVKGEDSECGGQCVSTPVVTSFWMTFEHFHGQGRAEQMVLRAIKVRAHVAHSWRQRVPV